MQIIYLLLFRRFVIYILPYFAATPNHHNLGSVMQQSWDYSFHCDIRSTFLCYFVAVVPFKKFFIFWARIDIVFSRQILTFWKSVDPPAKFTRSLFWSGVFVGWKCSVVRQSTEANRYTYPPVKMEQTECSETLAYSYKIQTLGNCPEESTQHSEQGQSLK
jgi:hypothetical protein